MDREKLAQFLRARRSHLGPAEIGLSSEGVRRTPGLRREEVAQLAAMSVDYYRRLEQRRGPRPSRQVLAALARALRLDDDERDHMYLLAGEMPPVEAMAGEVSPGLLRLLDRLQETPALVVDATGDALAWNPMHAALMGDLSRYSEEERNIFWLYFTAPDVQERFPEGDRPALAARHVANLRAASARFPDDNGLADLVDRLRTESGGFATLWEDHDVVDARRSSGVKRVRHPDVGLLELDCDVLIGAADGNRLVIYTAAPDSEAHRKLMMLKDAHPG